ncbi:MAG: ribonuclease E inhibitor RraB [Psychrobium sp.]
MDWPNDADGDVLRSLNECGLDFDTQHDIEFIVDFASWPPKQEVILILSQQYQNVQWHLPEHENKGYLLLVIQHLLTYQFVTETQLNLTEIASPYGGTCESWGLLIE